ncbi:TonB-dependent receptor [Polaribacter sp.]|nr:TonB-dependent receptor [Polaribacter sp.]
MKKFLFLLFLTVATVTIAQEKGTLKGLVTDKEANNEPLPFANILIKGTTNGGTTDFDGNYAFSVPAGTHTVVFSFLGYKTVQKTFTIKAGETVTINQAMSGEEGVGLEEVIVRASVSKEKESVLLLEQKKAVIIKESIGAQRLAQVGVSNASGATTKISGVTKTESSSGVYVRGLGDRYLSTTMNGLPIPSDEIDNKNINLDLFSTSIIKNVGISKTYSPSGYSDQAAGNVDISSKDYTKDFFSVGVTSGINSTVVGTDFRASANNQYKTFGFYNNDLPIRQRISDQSWDTESSNAFANYGFSIAGGKKFDVGEQQLSLFGTASYSKSFVYKEGVFRSFSGNTDDREFTDLESFTDTDNLTGLLNLTYDINQNNKITVNSLFINTAKDIFFEFGRNGNGVVTDQEPDDESAFIRDQNIKQTTLFTNQILGEHDFSEKNNLNWGFSVNTVNAEEPNRIRNQVSILEDNVQFAGATGINQKSEQQVEDFEYNGFIKDDIIFMNADDEESSRITLGANFRHKERDFASRIVQSNTLGLTADSVDDLTDAFVNFDTSLSNNITLTDISDVYTGTLDAFGVYTNYSFSLNKLSGSLGVRYETNEIFVVYDIETDTNSGDATKNYNSILPSVNLKYDLNDKNSLRGSFSLTNTLPEFKELAPFNYVTPLGRVIGGNPDLEKSDVLNLDLKWEMFLNSEELISLTGFYKKINDPINLSIERGSSGYYSYNNTGERANIYGLELEGRLNILEKDAFDLKGNFNVTGMLFEQDLLEEFQYKNKTSAAIQGASNLIANAAVSFNTNEEKPFTSTLSFNYSSDKVLIQGFPTIQSSRDTRYNDEIIEKGFVTLNLVLQKEILDGLSLTFSGRNLVNPEIQQTQNVLRVSTGVETERVVSSYRKGSIFSIGAKYVF